MRLPYEPREGENASVVVHARSKDYTLPDISAFVSASAGRADRRAVAGAARVGAHGGSPFVLIVIGIASVLR